MWWLLDREWWKSAILQMAYVAVMALTILLLTLVSLFAFVLHPLFGVVVAVWCVVKVRQWLHEDRAAARAKANQGEGPNG